jgi:capsular polysaccharide export protein
MTSLSGFDALLRGKPVVTYGQPFYAGWGLTVDKCQDGPAYARRTRRLSLDALVAGVLLRYPVYWDWELRGYTQCEAVLERLLAQRQALEQNGQLRRLSHGAGWRLWRKLKVLVMAWTNRF